MSDHPEIPRVSFNDDGEGMNIEQAVERFREMLRSKPGLEFFFELQVRVYTCDCESDIRGRDDYCPLHGDPRLQRE